MRTWHIGTARVSTVRAQDGCLNTAVPTRSPASRTAKIVLGVLLILVPLGIALGGLLIPVRAEVMQPAPPRHQWIGIPPTLTVECDRFWDPQPPTWPNGVKYIRQGARPGAVETCEAAHPTSDS